MIDREGVEALAAWAALGEIAIQPYGHAARMADSPVIAELCRVYLAWLDAPEGRVLTDDGDLLMVRMPDDDRPSMDEQRVRLVPVGGGE